MPSSSTNGALLVIDALLFGIEMQWDPGFRGALTVAVSVVILCGSVALLLSTNSGARLGFMLALTGFMGWMFAMGIIWSIYGIGWVGPNPSWDVADVVRSEPGSGVVDSRLDVAQSLPLPDELPDPVELRDNDPELLAAFPPTQRDPNLGDLVTVDPDLADTINEQADPWRILETSNRYTGETQATVGEALGPNGQAIFESPAGYQVIDSYLTGGRAQRADDSIVARAVHKVTQTLEFNPPTFYAVVQLQAVIPQEPKPGQAPPTPVRDETQPIISVVLERVDTGQKRIPAFATTIFSGLTTAVLCVMLHRRDKLAQAQRAATAGAS